MCPHTLPKPHAHDNACNRVTKHRSRWPPSRELHGHAQPGGRGEDPRPPCVSLKRLHAGGRPVLGVAQSWYAGTWGTCVSSESTAANTPRLPGRPSAPGVPRLRGECWAWSWTSGPFSSLLGWETP